MPRPGMPDGKTVPALVEGVDYSIDADGRWVFSAGHLKARGYCCFNGCTNCPWGQQGQGPREAFAELQRRLDTLEQQLQLEGWDIEVTGYRLGALHLRPPQTACATDLPGLEQQVLRHAQSLITVVELVWE